MCDCQEFLLFFESRVAFDLPQFRLMTGASGSSLLGDQRHICCRVFALKQLESTFRKQCFVVVRHGKQVEAASASYSDFFIGQWSGDDDWIREQQLSSRRQQARPLLE